MSVRLAIAWYNFTYLSDSLPLNCGHLKTDELGSICLPNRADYIGMLLVGKKSDRGSQLEGMPREEKDYQRS